tara:strand:- start:1060 stop:1323 length:264 start_codon:yes stop_codon:yes gene_type:complete
MPNIKEIMGRLTALQQEEATWEFVVHVLSEYVDGDAIQATKTIPVPDCVVGTVGQDALMAVIGKVTDSHLEPIRDKKRKLQDVQVEL